MKVLATASSPLQLVNAVESIQALAGDCTERHLVLRVLKGSNNERIMKELLKLQRWDSIYWYSSKRKILQLPNLLRTFKGTHWDYVIGGDFTAWWYNSLLANISCDNHVLCDDGAKTIVDYENCLVTGRLPKKKKGGKDLLLKLLGFRTMRFNFSPVLLYTIFELKDTQHCRVIHNNMSWLRSQIGSEVYSDDGVVLFIGQPLVDSQDVKPDKYYDIIKKVLNNTPSKKMIYTAHRGESETTLNKVKSLGNIELFQPSSPIELELHKMNQRVAMIVGLSSTALYTLKVLYEDLPAFRIELDDEDYTHDAVRQSSRKFHNFFGPTIPLYRLPSGIE